MSFENLVILESSSIRNALELLEKSGKKILFVIDKANKVKGVVTDGDIRRGLLKDIYLDNQIQNIMVSNFLFIIDGESYEKVEEKALELGIEGIPILDKDKKLKDIVWVNNKIYKRHKENIVIIMAGGKGTRLHPLTEDIPKPMIEINGYPMIHHLIKKLKKQGFINFVICVNYKKEVIQNYLGDGSKFNVQITYTEEFKPLGTAGSLALISPLDKPAILLNADIITDIDFEEIIFQNKKTKSDLIVVTKNDKVSVPYGVVETRGQKVIDIKEKPKYDFLINTGIYLITEKVRSLVKSDKFLDMPDLAKIALENKFSVEHYMCINNWIDVGRFETLKQARHYI